MSENNIHADVNNDKNYAPITLDPVKLVDSYLTQSSWRSKENSNVSYNVGGYNLFASGTISSAYWLDKVYPPEIRNAHKDAFMHIHDLSQLMGYCFDKKVPFILADGSEMTFEEAEQKGITEADVYSYNKVTGKKEVKHATDIGLRGVDDLYQIELDDGTIISGFTKWHEVVTKNRGLVRFDELTADDDIVEF